MKDIINNTIYTSWISSEKIRLNKEKIMKEKSTDEQFKDIITPYQPTVEEQLIELIYSISNQIVNISLQITPRGFSIKGIFKESR